MSTARDVNSMVRCVKIPVHVLKTKLSHSALVLWVKLAERSSPKNPRMTLNLQSLAEVMDRSKKTVSRLIVELEQAGLLRRGDVIDRQHRIGTLVWVKDEPPYAKASGGKPPVKKITDPLDYIPPELHGEAIRITKECTTPAEFELKINNLLREHRKRQSSSGTVGYA